MKHNYKLYVGDVLKASNEMTEKQAASANTQLLKDDSPARWVRVFPEKVKKPLESQVQAKILEALGKLPGCYFIKIHGERYQKSGTPDIIGCINSQMFCIEVKRSAKEKAIPLQLAELKKWNAAGALTGVAWTVEMAINIIEGG